MNLSRCRFCGASVRVELLPGWGEEPVKHECAPVCHQCSAIGECQARTPCAATLRDRADTIEKETDRG